MEVLVIVFGALVIGVVLGGLLARVFSPRVAMICGLILVVLAVVLLVIGERIQGYEGLGYSIPALVAVLPSAVGCGLTGLVAWYFRRSKP